MYARASFHSPKTCRLTGNSIPQLFLKYHNISISKYRKDAIISKCSYLRRWNWKIQQAIMQLSRLLIINLCCRWNPCYCLHLLSFKEKTHQNIFCVFVPNVMLICSHLTLTHLLLLSIIRLLLTSPRPTCPRLSASNCWHMSERKSETEKKTRRKKKKRSGAACPTLPSWSSRSWHWTEKCWTNFPPLTTKQVCVYS